MFVMLKMLKKLNRISKFGFSPNTPKLGNPNRFERLISTFKYFGPRNTLRPIAGGLSTKLFPAFRRVKKSALHPPGTAALSQATRVPFAFKTRLPGKTPPALRKFEFELANCSRPLYLIGRNGPIVFPLGYSYSTQDENKEPAPQDAKQRAYAMHLKPP